jgi:mono/diheme cytochrome c family protein
VGKSRDTLWLATQIRDPKSHNANTQMPAFSQIPEGEIHALVGYLLSLK